jgi:hypothetical protein
MIRKYITFLSVLIFPVAFLMGEPLGEVSLQKGEPLPFDKGVSWEYEGGYIQVFIHDDMFTAVFLDADRKVRVLDDIELITVNSKIVGGNDQLYPYHLQPSPGRVYYQNPREVFHPLKYHIEVSLRKEVPRFFSRPKYVEKRFVRPSFEMKLLDQE